MTVTTFANLPGEMARRIREMDWSATPLGSSDTWPQSLKLSLTMILVSGFPMAIRWGAELVLIYNDAYRPILRDKHPDALGRPLREVWWEVYPELGRLNEAILRGERGAFFAEDLLWTVQRQGRVVENARFTISYSPIPDAAAPNGIAGVLTTCVETTKRVHKEEALRVLNERLEFEIAERIRERDRIWHVSEDLLGVSNFDGYFTSVNPAWTTLLGWSEEEIKRMHVGELRHPDDAAHSIAGRRRLAEGVPTVRMENRFRHKDGSWRWLAWTLTVENGLIYLIGRHVTAEKLAAEALRESERQFRLFTEAATDHALIRLDARGVVSGWNAGAQRITGYTEQEIVGHHFSLFYTTSDRTADAPERALEAAATAGAYEHDGWRVRKNGSLFLAAVVIDAIRDEDGKLIGFANIMRDVTERHEARAKLQRAQEQLAQSQKMDALGQLTGGIAHDFNNMLTVVSGNAQILKRRLRNPKNRRSVAAIELASTRGEHLTRQLLAFSRRQALNPIVISLRQRVAAFRELLGSSARGDIRLNIDIPPNIWPVAVDVHELELALVNLVVNSRDAMPDGGAVTITAKNVRLRPQDTPDHLSGEFVALVVADTGCGIEPDLLAKVFEPFFTTKQLEKGTGLGLSQVYGLTRQSGGTVTISSEPGNGTTVILYLPRSHSPLSDQPTIGDEPPGGRETILLVEDNPDVQEVADMLLQQLGYRVLRVRSADAALQLLESGEAVDLVFTDIIMPGKVDGIALARRVQEEYPDIGVLLTSGYAKAANSRESGFPILRKPYQISTLAHAIRSVLDTEPARLLTRSGRADMKIGRIETFILGTGSGKDLLFCRVETEDGLHGWGEAYVTHGKEKVVAGCIEAMAPHLIGRSAFNIRHTGQIMFEDFAIRRISLELMAAWSAIEIASWDIIGKRAGLPVYNLIGGASRERVRVYANGWSRGTTIEEGVDRGRKVKAMGFTAAKFDPFPGPWRSFVDRRDEDFAIDYVRAMRQALGSDFELLIEAHRRFAPAHAIRIGHRLAEFGIDWYEEPCLSENIDLVAEVRRAVPIPIVTGEAIYSKEAFFECLAKRAADILNPDICAVGGITAMLDIAAMAQPQAVVMSPHNYNSTLVGLAATVHLSAVIPNFRITEYFVNFQDLCREIAAASLTVQDGWVDLPTTPGLGIDIDVNKLRAHPHQEATHLGFRQYWEEYPRKGYAPRLRG